MLRHPLISSVLGSLMFWDSLKYASLSSGLLEAMNGNPSQWSASNSTKAYWTAANADSLMVVFSWSFCLLGLSGLSVLPGVAESSGSAGSGLRGLPGLLGMLGLLGV